MADPTPAPTAAAHPSHPQRLRRAQPVPPADLRAALSVIDNDLARIEARASRGTKALGADGREVPEEEAMMGGGGAKQFQSQPSQSQSSVAGAGAVAGAVVEVDLTSAERTELEARAKAGRSLRRNLERMCQPASDGEGGEGGGRFAAEERMERIRRDMDPDADADDDDNDDADDDADPSGDAADEGAAIDHDDPDRSFEETQLVDQDALRRARELRGRVRDLASRIRRGREGTTRRASDLVGREVEAMRLAVGAGGGADVDDADAEDDAGAAAAMAVAQVEEVREALRSLEEAARGLEGGGRTGEALADLAATAEAVQGALERGGGAGAGAGAAAKLSQTERAILAKPEREGAGGTMHAAEDPEARARIGAMDPADRLAAFLDGGAAPSVV